MAAPRQSGQTGAAPAGQKQDAMPVNHSKSVKPAPTVNRQGGAHPAARRALSQKASSHASRRATQAAQPGAGTPGGTGSMNQDSLLNVPNAMDQDAGLSSGSDFTY